MRDVDSAACGAAFGAILAAFDTGIGTRIDDGGLADPAVRLRDGVRHRGGAGGDRAAP